MAATAIRIAISLGLGLLAAVGYAYKNRRRQQQQQQQQQQQPRTQYHPDTEKTFKLNICPICKGPIGENDDFKLPCGDVYHKVCLAHVFQEQVVGKRSCPKCRVNVPENFVPLVHEA